MIGEAAATGGIAAVVVVTALGVAVYVARTWIGTRVREAVRLGYRKEIEEHKHDLRIAEGALLEEIRKLNAQIQAVQGTANSAFVEGQRVAAEWRIKAANDLWVEILRFNSTHPPAFLYLMILHPDEYQEIALRDDYRKVALTIDENEVWPIEIKIEYVRLFLGEKVFAMFFSYRAILGRIALLLRDGAIKGKIPLWIEDRAIQFHLEQVLPKEDFTRILEHPSPFTELTSTFEGRILGELRRFISGDVSASEGFEQGQKILEKVRRAETMFGEPQEPGGGLGAGVSG